MRKKWHESKRGKRHALQAFAIALTSSQEESHVTPRSRRRCSLLLQGFFSNKKTYHENITPESDKKSQMSFLNSRQGNRCHETPVVGSSSTQDYYSIYRLKTKEVGNDLFKNSAHLLVIRSRVSLLRNSIEMQVYRLDVLPLFRVSLLLSVLMSRDIHVSVMTLVHFGVITGFRHDSRLNFQTLLVVVLCLLSFDVGILHVSSPLK